MKLTFKNLNDPQFNQTLNRLSRETGFANFKAAYNVSKIMRRLTKELKEARALNEKIMAEYVEKNEDGTTKFDVETKLPVFKSEEAEKEYFAKHKDFLETEFEIDCYPIKLDDLGTIKLSPHEINAIHDILVLDTEEEA